MSKTITQAENKRLSTAMLLACEQKLLTSHEVAFIRQIILLWSDYTAIPAYKLEELANSTPFIFAHNTLLKANVIEVVKPDVYRFNPDNITHGNLKFARKLAVDILFGSAK